MFPDQNIPAEKFPTFNSDKETGSETAWHCKITSTAKLNNNHYH